MTPIRIHWTRTEEDYVRAVRLHQSKLRAHRLLSRVLFPLMAVALALYWLLFGRDLLIVAFTTAFSVLLVLFVGVRWLGVPLHARRVFRQQKSLQRPVTLEIDETGLRASTGDDDRSSLVWEDCHRWVEGETDFLIYPSDAIFYFIPKHHLGDEGVAQLRTLLTERVPS